MMLFTEFKSLFPKKNPFTGIAIKLSDEITIK